MAARQGRGVGKGCGALDGQAADSPPSCRYVLGGGAICMELLTKQVSLRPAVAQEGLR